MFILVCGEFMFELAYFLVILVLFVSFPRLGCCMWCGSAYHLDGFFEVFQVVGCESADSCAVGIEGLFSCGFPSFEGWL